MTMAGRGCVVQKAAVIGTDMKAQEQYAINVIGFLLKAY
jgi:hypothetical protein